MHKHHGKKMRCGAGWLTYTLVIVGALNWGLVGIGGFMGSDLNLVDMIFGAGSTLSAVIYIVVGLAGVVLLFGGCRCKKCRGGMCKNGMCAGVCGDCGVGCKCVDGKCVCDDKGMKEEKKEM